MATRTTVTAGRSEPGGDVLLTIDQVAQAVGIKRTWVCPWARRRGIPSYRCGRRIYYAEQPVRAAIAADPTPPPDLPPTGGVAERAAHLLSLRRMAERSRIGVL